MFFTRRIYPCHQLDCDSLDQEVMIPIFLTFPMCNKYCVMPVCERLRRVTDCIVRVCKILCCQKSLRIAPCKNIPLRKSFYKKWSRLSCKLTEWKKILIWFKEAKEKRQIVLKISKKSTKLFLNIHLLIDHEYLLVGHLKKMYHRLLTRQKKLTIYKRSQLWVTVQYTEQ